MNDLESRRNAFLDLGDEPYIRLTTTRRSGATVPTAVWVVRDGDRLLVTTVAGSGKVQRIAHTPRVTVAASDIQGVVTDAATELSAIAAEDASSEVREVLDRALTEKYGERYAEIRSAREARDPESRSTALVLTCDET